MYVEYVDSLDLSRVRRRNRSIALMVLSSLTIAGGGLPSFGSMRMGGRPPIFRLLLLLLPLIMAMVDRTQAVASIDRSFYHDLGVDYNATTDNVVEAYQQHFQTWRVDKQYDPAEIQKIIQIEHAYHVLSNNLTRRDYDFFQYDPLQADLVRVRKQFEGKTEPQYVEFPLWEPAILSERIESTAETVTYANFGDLVLHSLDVWVIQIYSLSSPECHAFAPVWDKTVDALEGVVKVGRLELGEMPLTLILAERNWLHGFPFFRNGLPAIITVHPGCETLGCITRYYGGKTSEEIADWVASRILKLPRILYYSEQTLMSDIIQKPGPHKVKVIQFSATGERAALHLRKAVRDFSEYAVFAMVLWRESEAVFWENRPPDGIGVEYGPATVFIKDPGLPPVIHHGKLNSSTFQELMENHKTFELPQLRGITSANLGCDVSSPSRAGNETKIWYCVIVVGRPSLALNQLRGVVRGVQEQLTRGPTEEMPVTPAVKAFNEKRLSLAWLDGEIQKKFCYFYLSSESMFEACGPRKYGLQDIPKIFLIRYIKVQLKEENTESQKKRWLPKTTWEREAEEDSKYAAQLVTKYNGSAVVPEIVHWIATMVTQGDNEDLPSFRGKSPDLVPEEKVPFTEKTQEFVFEKKERLLEKGRGYLRIAQDFKNDPKFFPIVAFVALFYIAAFYLRANQKTAKANQVSTEAAASGGLQDASPDSTPYQDSTVSEGSSEQNVSGRLRRREPFQSS